MRDINDIEDEDRVSVWARLAKEMGFYWIVTSPSASQAVWF